MEKHKYNPEVVYEQGQLWLRWDEGNGADSRLTYPEKQITKYGKNGLLYGKVWAKQIRPNGSSGKNKQQLSWLYEINVLN